MGARRDGVGVLVAPADGGARPTADPTGEGDSVPGLHDQAGQRLLHDGRELVPRVTRNLQAINQSSNQSSNQSVSQSVNQSVSQSISQSVSQ